MDSISEDSTVKMNEDNNLRLNASSTEGLNDSCDKNDDMHEGRDKNDTAEGYKSITELTSDDIWGLEFNSELEACEFYHNYARCHGFAMRKDDVSRDGKGRIVMRQLVCNKEGKRNKRHFTRLDRVRDHRPTTRTKCPARIRVSLDYRSSKWKVVSFVESHNHELAPTQFIHLIPANRAMSDADKAQADSLHLYGVRTCHIMGLMKGQKGGYSKVGFSKKDLYNHLDKSRRAKMEDGDAMAALSYLQAKADNDPLLFEKHTLTKDDKLQHLFWADGNSRIDYQCFGDVLAFDSTYKKNKYNQPLIIFSGCNHHGQTTIFGCALVADEKIETYTWVLETFVEAMFNKHPSSVVTDGDGAMREAIKLVFPNAHHRLCGWHLQSNACENVKNPEFLKDFKTAIYSNFKVDGFEEFWKNMIEKHGVSNNKWVKKIYEIKEMWASAYVRDKFFAGIRTTSQCEGINSFIKRHVGKKNSLVDFMSNFERALSEYRHNELIAEFKSMFTEPVMTTPLYEIEVGASKIYTQQKFKEVKEEIDVACSLNIIERLERENEVKFKMNKYCSPNSEYEVIYDKTVSKFICDCCLFESRGIPCSHIFCSMKHEHMNTIPTSLICKRWTKVAKNDYISLIANSQSDDSQKVATIRFAALSAACNQLCHLASKNFDDFNFIRDEIFKLTRKLHGANSNHDSSAKVVGDPTVVRTKGAPPKRKYLKKRRCSNCKKTGHSIRKCPRLVVSDSECEDNCDTLGSTSNGETRETEKHDLSCDDNKSMHSDPAQTVDSNEKTQHIKGAAMRTRKKEKLVISTQNSANECEQNVVTDHNDHSKPVVTTIAENNMTLLESMIRAGENVIGSKQSLVAPQNMSPIYQPLTQVKTVFPPYYGVPVYPQIPSYSTPNRSIAFFPQSMGGMPTFQGGMPIFQGEMLSVQGQMPTAQGGSQQHGMRRDDSGT